MSLKPTANDVFGSAFQSQMALAELYDFLKDRNSWPTPNPSKNAHLTIQWDEDLIFTALGDPVRRRLIIELGRRGPTTGAQLKAGVGRSADNALKHLAVLRSAGLVKMTDNPADGRRALYSLAPTVPLVMTETSCEIDFGFCLLRLKPV